jgi:hypothetical protein
MVRTSHEDQLARQAQALKDIEDTKGVVARRRLNMERYFAAMIDSVGGYSETVIAELLADCPEVEFPFEVVRSNGRYGIERKSLMAYVVAQIREGDPEEVHPEDDIKHLMLMAEKHGLISESTKVRVGDRTCWAHFVRQLTDQRFSELTDKVWLAIKELEEQLGLTEASWLR